MVPMLSAVSTILNQWTLGNVNFGANRSPDELCDGDWSVHQRIGQER